MDDIPRAIMIFIPILLFFVKPGGEVWWPPLCILQIGIVFFIALHVRARLSVKLFLGYAVVQSMAWALYRNLTPLSAPLSHEELETILLIRITAMSFALQTLAMAWAFKYWKQIRLPLAIGLYFGGFAQAIMLIWDQLIKRYQTGLVEIGLLGNRSIGASFTVLWCFFVAHWLTKNRRGIWPSLIGGFAVVISSSIISYVALLAGTLTSIFLISERKWRIGLTFASLGAISVPFVTPKIYAYNGRFDAWKMWFEWWIHNASKWWGTGFGTFSYFGIQIQEKAKFMPGRALLFAHSDWFEILFAGGYVGLALAAFLYLDALWSSRKEPFLVSGIVAMGVIMAGNYPLEIAASLLICWWMLAEGFFVGLKGHEEIIREMWERRE